MESSAGAPTKLSTPQFQIPYYRNPHFTGRSQLLKDLHETLTGEKVAALSQAAALSGLGGIGKTQTAIEYAYRYFYDSPTYEWVFWVRADTDLSLVTGLAEIAKSFDLRGDKLDELATQAKRWLETHDRWLLIFDNADKPNLLKPWLPNNPQGRVLLTSRARLFAGLGIRTPIELKKLSSEESSTFLRERTDCQSLEGAELAAATALAQALDGLPLALEQAAAYINRVGVSFAVYWKYYQQRRLVLLEEESPETGDYPQSVATTWLLNFEEVERRSPASIPILQLSAVLAGDDIPEALLFVCAEEFGLTNCADELALAEQLAALADFSLIERERQSVSYSIHRMVQAVVWHGLTATEQQDWINRAIAGLNAAFPDVEKFENWAVCGRLVPHVQAIATHPSANTLEITDWALLLNRAGYYLKEQGRYEAAEPLYVRSLRLYEQQLGADHPDTASSLNNLAALHWVQGQYEAAELSYTRSLQTCEQRLGADHHSTAIILNNLAELYKSQGRYDEAEPLYVRSLQIREQQLGVDHPSTGNSLNNLAGLYKSQGRYDEAEPLLVRSLQIYEQQLGIDHPNTATGLNNLAQLYEAQGRYDEAEPLYMRSLQIREQQLRADHPTMAISLNNLAQLYEAQGRYNEAEPLLVRSLQIYEQQLGADHPDTATGCGNLAGVYAATGRYAEAEPLHKRALAIHQQQLGKDHPATATSLNNLAGLYQSQRRYDEAEPLSVRSLQILTTKFGLTHPKTQQVQTNLAILYDDIAAQCKLQGHYDRVVEYLEKAIALRQSIE
ncbi:FxSxx-COOH system tetratricopeptide repeat protein [Phormidesmis priestleyi]